MAPKMIDELQNLYNELDHAERRWLNCLDDLDDADETADDQFLKHLPTVFADCAAISSKRLTVRASH